MKISVCTVVAAPLHQVWASYTNPEDIKVWNTASPEWHSTAASVDLRVGGQFTSRMEAKDGSFGFDFAGEYTKIVPEQSIEYVFGERSACVTFVQTDAGVAVTVVFDAESTHPEEQQRSGWQAILDSFARHTAGPAVAG